MSSEKPVADVLLELYRLGELPPALRSSMERRLSEDADARARLEELEASDREILGAYPPERMTAAIRRRAGVTPLAPRRARRPLFLAVPALAAAALVVVLVQRVEPGAGPEKRVPGLEDTRLKGLKPHLMAYLVHGTNAERLDDGAAASAGNTLQLSYIAAGQRYGVIVSIDGRGQVTLHLPVTAGEAAPLDPDGGEVALPRTYQLDDAPDFERFFFITSDAPLTTERILEAGRALVTQHNAAGGSLPLPGGLDQSTLTLHKVSP
jgi:hypothetical protein